FILFPLFAQGMFSRVEMTMFPSYLQQRSQEQSEKRDGASGQGKRERRSEDGAGGGRDERREEQFQRVRFRAEFPALGAIDVDFSHSLQSAFVTISTADRDVGRFLEDKRAAAEELLRQLGFEIASCSVSTSLDEAFRPDWLEALRRPSAAIA
ncbi:MAG: hypothetical protein KDD44_08845, partial [Bdellovibrionales bacterium]|nr:hypothetical protein [Bdellovibrionales bacterium]